MDKQRLTLSVLTLLPLAVACGTETAGSGSAGTGSSPVTGVHWSVDTLTTQGRTRQAPDSAYLRIGEDGRVSGNLGCNGFGTTATLKGERIDFGEIEATDMGCQKDPMTFEETLSRAYADDTFTSEVKGDKLTLTTDGGDRVSLTKEPDAPLYGTKWTVTSLGDGGVAQSLPEEPTPTSPSTRRTAPFPVASAATTSPPRPPSATDASPSAPPRPPG